MSSIGGVFRTALFMESTSESVSEPHSVDTIPAHSGVRIYGFRLAYDNGVVLSLISKDANLNSRFR